MIVGASYVLRDNCRNCIPVSSKALPRRVWGLRVADSHTEDPIQARRGGLRAGGEGKSIITIFLIMSVKDSVTTQTCELSKEEFNDFLTLYPIPSEYRVILPKSNQTIFDAPPRFIYRGSALLVVPSSPLLLSCAKLMVVSPLSTSSDGSSICVELVITRIEGWHERFFYVQDSIIPAKYPQLLSEQNKLDSKSFKDKLPPNIEENPMSQRLSRYPTSVRVFPDPILFLPVEVTADSGDSPKPELFVVHPGSVSARIKDRKCKTRGGSSRPLVKRKLSPRSLTSCATRAKTSSSKDDAPFLTVSDDDEGLPDVLKLKDATACHLKIFAITPPA
ncbi:hypothetical protein Tco_0097945 [Tanacetum coccineum]